MASPGTLGYADAGLLANTLAQPKAYTGYLPVHAYLCETQKPFVTLHLIILQAILQLGNAQATRSPRALT